MQSASLKFQPPEVPRSAPSPGPGSKLAALLTLAGAIFAGAILRRRRRSPAGPNNRENPEVELRGGTDAVAEDGRYAATTTVRGANAPG